MNQTKLFVLAGGFGTRLRSAVSEVPKPLAPVGDRPFLSFLIESWLAQGVTQMTFLLHHQAELIEAFLAHQQTQGQLQGCELHILREQQPLGTGGAVAYAVQQLQLTGSFLITNADTWLGAGIKETAAADAPAMASVQVSNTERYGSIQVRQNKVANFKEKHDSGGPGLINAGLYHLHADLFRDWNGQSFSLEQTLFPKLVALEKLGSVPLETDFIDIGIPDDYYRFCRWIDSKKTGVL